ncbi:MAG TPA: thiamine pyrophosphate-dependent enzyme [Chthonomonadaceae bacterium]|nr:thiamine pyrophosphate-dependent enzyme [Chthonomonadaceae bacterium]
MPPERDLDAPLQAGSALKGRDVIELFESQMVARHQDIEARNMRARNEGFYTIGSAGHEGNAVVGRLTRPTDIAFLHYRSGAFLAERARQVPGQDFVRDTMLSFAASACDPIAGGRHKVWGSVPLWVPPQTSTIASHLPKSVGTAFFLRRAHKLGTVPELPEDTIVVCSFGDASINHAAAQTAFNAAAWTAFQGLPMPILFVCEDNGVGISVPTPPEWVRASMSARPGIRYFVADGLDLVAAYAVAQEAIDDCRLRRAPVFLHLKVVRLMGHAGTDAEHGYRSWEQIEATEAQDPLLRTARLALSAGVMTTEEVLEQYERIRARVEEAARFAATQPRLSRAEEVMAPLAPYHPEAVHAEASRVPTLEARRRALGADEPLPETGPPRHLAALIALGLRDLLAKYPEAVLFGEDVAKKGGVYNVTAGLEAAFGPGRVFNTLLDETTILGLGIGAGQLGLLPLPEIQYLAYVHNAEDQIRGEACSLQFFSQGQYKNPMVVRVQGWSYQKGFGGHFHNDNSIAALRDVPGLVIATPSRGDDAVRMLRTLTALAKVDGRVSLFIEPIALYMTRDLYAPKDGLWQFPYPAPGECIPLGEGAVYHEDAQDLTILTFANGLYMSLRAAKTLKEKHGLSARVVDLRWLNPLNEEFIVSQAQATGRVLVMDESRKTGGLAEAILALLTERCDSGLRAARLNALDTYVPLGPAADCVLPAEEDIVTHSLALLKLK